MLTRVNEITAKTILTRSGLPGSDWVINPYNGCQMGCMYCYAAQIARWKHPAEEWGSYLDVKINAADLLKKELNKFSRRDAKSGFSTFNKNFGSIFLSSVTDPYTPLEARYKLTRQCLEVLADFGYEGEINVQTKSPLATRDIDLLKKFKNIAIGYTITTLDDRVSRFMEVWAPSYTDRFNALAKLHENGISTYAFIGPIMPNVIDNAGRLNELFDKLEQVGVKKIWLEHINLSSKIKSRLFEYLQKTSPKLIPIFDQADNAHYRDKLNQVIFDCLKNRHFEIGLDKIIYHHDLPKKNYETSTR